ncbi:MAG: hypothetical protein KDA42_01900, partial [Planctomycetales bacterium]|nr:hypothetical protein [Planctomycetales bacterium]
EKQAAQAQQTAQQQAEKLAADAKRLADEAAQNNDDANLAQQRDAAKKAADEAANQATAAQQALEAKQKELTEATQQAETAKAEMETAKQAADAATAAEKQAQDEQKNVAKRATDLANAAKPKDIDTFAASTPITLVVYEAPIELSAASPAAAIKQGESGEVAVSLKRLLGYNDEVEIQAQAPNGVSGLALKNTKVDAGQTEVKLAIEANAQATPGEHQITVRAKPKYNGQTLEVVQTVAVKIEAVEAEKK